MAEILGSDQPAAETPSEEVQTEDTELQSEQEQGGEEGEEEGEPADDSEEVEHEGAKYRIPKALKGALLMQSDYTRKTQEVAEQRKSLESERQTFAKSQETYMQHVAEIGRVKVLDETLEQYSKVDWQTLRAQNPEQANAAFQDYMTLKTQRDTLASKVSTDIQSRSQESQREFAKRYADAEAELQRDIPGWNQETAVKVRDFAFANGITQDELKEVAVNPRLSKILHLAWMGKQLQSKQQAAAKAAKVAPIVAEPKPLAVVGRKPSGTAKTGLNDDLSVNEWLKRREAQVRGRA